MELAKINGAAALGLVLSAGGAQAECGEFSLTQTDRASTNPAMTSVAETGEPDTLTELWVNSTSAYEKLVEQGKIVPLTDVLSGGRQEGWWIPRYMVDEHPELATVDGVLANPDLLGGRFHNCPDGWACRTVNDNIATAAGLEEAGYEIFNRGSGERLATAIAPRPSRIRTPGSVTNRLPRQFWASNPMVMVDRGTYKSEVHECNRNPECRTPSVSPHPASTVLTVVTEDFKEPKPEATELTLRVSFNNAVMGKILAWLNDAGRDKLPAILQ